MGTAINMGSLPGPPRLLLLLACRQRLSRPSRWEPEISAVHLNQAGEFIVSVPALHATYGPRKFEVIFGYIIAQFGCNRVVFTFVFSTGLQWVRP